MVQALGLNPFHFGGSATCLIHSHSFGGSAACLIHSHSFSGSAAYLIHSYLCSSVSPENSSCGTSLVCASNGPSCYFGRDSLLTSTFLSSAFLTIGCSYAFTSLTSLFYAAAATWAGIASLNVYRGALAQFCSIFLIVSSPGPPPETKEYLNSLSFSGSKTGSYFAGNF